MGYEIPCPDCFSLPNTLKIDMRVAAKFLKDPAFYLDDGDCVICVEDTLFRVCIPLQSTKPLSF